MLRLSFHLHRVLPLGDIGSLDRWHGLCRDALVIETALQIRLRHRLAELHTFMSGRGTYPNFIKHLRLCGVKLLRLRSVRTETGPCGGCPLRT